MMIQMNNNFNCSRNGSVNLFIEDQVYTPGDAAVTEECQLS